MLNLTDKNFKAVIIKMVKKLKEIVLKNVKEDTVAMSHQMENINKKKFF